MLTSSTKASAAKAAGISETTLRTYLKDSEFQKAYKDAFGQLVTEATRQAQQSLSTAILVLRNIAANESENGQTRVAAARSLLEYGLKLTEFNDILQELAIIEGDV